MRSSNPFRYPAKVMLALAALASFGTLGVVVFAGKGGDHQASWWVGTLTYAAWAISPYMALAWFAIRWRGVARPVVAVLGTVGVSAFGAWAYYDGFFVHFDAQSALLLIFVPLWQWVGVAAVAGIGAALERKRGTSGRA